jgi:hypothetical protein
MSEEDTPKRHPQNSIVPGSTESDLSHFIIRRLTSTPSNPITTGPNSTSTTAAVGAELAVPADHNRMISEISTFMESEMNIEF